MASRLTRTFMVPLALLCAAVVPLAASAATPKSVERVTRDYRGDGRIDPCRHTAKALRLTRTAIEADTEQYAPDFRIAINAALQSRADGECEEETSTSGGSGSGSGSGGGNGSGSSGSGSGSGGGSGSGSSGGSGTGTSGDSGTGSSGGAGAGSGSGSTTTDPGTGSTAPEVSKDEDSVTPVPPASSDDAGTPLAPAPEIPAETPTPAPTVPPAPATTTPPAGAGVTPGVPPQGDAQPGVVLTRPAAANDGASIPLVILGALLGLGLLAALLALVSRRLGWGEERLAGTRHAWSEASYRTAGTWQDFTDWVRLGR